MNPTPAEAMLDLRPHTPDQPLISRTVAKHIIGQGVVQLGLLGWLLLQSTGPGSLAGVDRSVHFTLLFNTFVFMQLFNQVQQRVF